MSGPVSERPAGTRRVLDFINRLGQAVTRSDVRKRFPHTSPKLLQEILTCLVEDGDLEIETDVDRELDTFTPARANGRRRVAPSPPQKTLREEIDELLDRQDAWSGVELQAALPHRTWKYLEIGLATEKRAGRVVRVEVDGRQVYCRPATAAKYDTNNPSGDGGSSQAEKTVLASPAGKPVTATVTVGDIPQEPVESSAPAGPMEPAPTVASSPAGAVPSNEGDRPLEESTANARQVGGAHYKKWTIQPWDFIELNGLTFCSGNVIKYICRFRDKGGVEDLEKAKHYLEKLIEVERERARQ